MAGERLTRGAQAARALSETLWEALGEELGALRRQRIIELSERLADVSGAMALLARIEGPVPAPSEPQPEPPSAVSRPPRDAPSSVAPSSAALTPAPPPVSPPPVSPPPAVPGRAVLVDERAEAKGEIEIKDERRGAVLREAARREHAARERAATDERQASPWIASIERRLERYQRDRLPFAVLLVELADVERLRHAELPGEMARMTGAVEAALAGGLRPADSLTRESPGRYWLLAPDTDLDGARALAERMSEAVRGAAEHRGEPLLIATGIAVCPADGCAPAALAAHADIGLYAARAAGQSLAP